MSRENLVLGEGVVLPDDVEVGANVVIHTGTIIGAGSVIQDNVVLGKTPKLADDDGLYLAHAVPLGGRVDETLFHQRREARGGDVLDVRLSAVYLGHPRHR